MQKAQTQHICLPKGGQYSEDRFVMNQSRVFRIKTGGGNRHPDKARKCQGIRQFTMRSISMFIFLLIAVVSFSQAVTITGTAFDSTNGRLPVHVVVNDSLPSKIDAPTLDKNEAYSTGATMLAVEEIVSMVF